MVEIKTRTNQTMHHHDVKDAQQCATECFHKQKNRMTFNNNPKELDGKSVEGGERKQRKGERQRYKGKNKLDLIEK